MPATAGRVRMPHNNRMSTSATLKTSEVWQKTIGHDPHAPPQDDANDAIHKKQQDEATAAVFAAARAQTVSTSVVADFSSQLFHGLKAKSAPTTEDHMHERQTKSSELLDEPMSSSEDEFIVARKDRRQSSKKKSKKRKHKRGSSDEEVSTDDEDSRNKSKKKKKHHRSKKKRKKKHYSSSDESSTEQKQKKHRKKSKSSASKGQRVEKKKGPSFIPAGEFEGSKSGYVFHTGPEGVGYYEDRH